MAGDQETGLESVVPSGGTDIGDFAGFGKAVGALLKHIASAVGTLYRPRAIRTERKAEIDMKAYEEVRMAQAHLVAAVVRGDEPDELRARAGARVLAMELERQKNIDAVVAQTVELLAAGDPETEPGEINHDWLRLYFDHVKDVSDERVRSIWAQILAREAVVDQRSVSLMTLDALRLLEPVHARIFEELCRCYYTFDFCLPFGYLQDEPSRYGGLNVYHALEDLQLIRSFTLGSSEGASDHPVIRTRSPNFMLELYDRQAEATPYSVIVHFEPAFRGEEIARVVLGTDFVDSRSNIRFSAEGPYALLDEERQAVVLREWFDVCAENGYTAVVSSKEGESPAYRATWSEGRLALEDGSNSSDLPAEVQLLLAE